jgi:nucleoid DNA-binding protein
MNKGQLVEIVAEKLGESKAQASRMVDAVFDSLVEGIQRDDSVTISGFGSFNKKERAARTGRHPMTGEPMAIRASTTVGYRPSQSLKDSLDHRSTAAKLRTAS